MKNQYYFDSGFTSTSLLKNKSFFGKNHGGTDYNIEIEYFIPNECSDGIALINDDLSEEEMNKKTLEILKDGEDINIVFENGKEKEKRLSNKFKVFEVNKLFVASTTPSISLFLFL